MYTPMMKHRTPNVVEGIALNGVGGLGDVSDYIPAGVTGAWEDIKAQIGGVATSQWFGYAVIGLGALFVYSAFGGFGGHGGGGRRRR